VETSSLFALFGQDCRSTPVHLLQTPRSVFVYCSFAHTFAVYTQCSIGLPSEQSSRTSLSSYASRRLLDPRIVAPVLAWRQSVKSAFVRIPARMVRILPILESMFCTRTMRMARIQPNRRFSCSRTYSAYVLMSG